MSASQIKKKSKSCAIICAPFSKGGEYKSTLLFGLAFSITTITTTTLSVTYFPVLFISILIIKEKVKKKKVAVLYQCNYSACLT